MVCVIDDEATHNGEPRDTKKCYFQRVSCFVVSWCDTGNTLQGDCNFRKISQSSMKKVKPNEPIWKTKEFAALKEHVNEIKKTHLRDLVKVRNTHPNTRYRDERAPRRQNTERSLSMKAEYDGIFLDYSRQCATAKTMNLLMRLARSADLEMKLASMASGAKLNVTEDRAVLHVALRAPKSQSILVDGKDVVPEVHKVLERVASFSKSVREGKWRGASGKVLTSVVAIGIGGSYLGPEFVYEALRTNERASKCAKGRTLRFLANVDPVDVSRALNGLDPESTLVVVVSKSFTTAETMLNARTLRSWLLKHYNGRTKIKESEVVSKHVIALSANVRF